ncbi:MAG TPA: hypothetical protein VF041_23265 [Gemmatimonadaceae bacterium]
MFWVEVDEGVYVNLARVREAMFYEEGGETVAHLFMIDRDSEGEQASYQFAGETAAALEKRIARWCRDEDGPPSQADHNSARRGRLVE